MVKLYGIIGPIADMVKLYGINDVAEQWQLGLQDGGSTGMEEMAGFHDQVMFVVVVISIGVL